MQLNRKVATAALIGVVAGGPLAVAVPALADQGVQSPAATSAPAPKPGEATYKVTAKSGVNVRSGPGTKYQRIGHLKNGTTVKGTGKSSKGWVQVKWGKKTGWVAGSYVKRVR